MLTRPLLKKQFIAMKGRNLKTQIEELRRGNALAKEPIVFPMHNNTRILGYNGG